MKKIMLGLLVVLTAMAFVSCSQFGAAGNPTALTGTWTGAQSSTSGSTSLAELSEGTWTSSSHKVPVPPAVISTTISGVSTVITGYDNTGGFGYNNNILVPGTQDTLTSDDDVTLVISNDASWTRTRTVTTTQTLAALVAAVTSGATQTNGAAAVAAGTKSITVTQVVTITENIDGTFAEHSVTTKTASATGDFIGKTDAIFSGTVLLTAAEQTLVNDVTDPDIGTSAVTYNTVGLDQDSQYPGDAYNETKAWAYSLVITDPGAFTLTTTETDTDNAPGAGGTAVTTTVVTGTVLGATGVGEDAGDQLVTFNETGRTVTYQGTGTMIEATFPETAATVTFTESGSNCYQYLITKGTDNTFLQIFSTSSSVNGYSMSWPTLTLSK